MDPQDQRKRAFSQAFQKLNQSRLSDNDSQAAKRVFSYPLGPTALYHQDCNQENETPLDLDYSVAFKQIPGTQIRHPPPVDLQYANPILYNYASLQYALYGNGPGPELESVDGTMQRPAAPKRPYQGPVLHEAALPTPQYVRGQSMFGPSPYIRPDSSSSLGNMIDSYAQSRPGPFIYEDECSPMSNATTAVGPLTPSALDFGDLSLNSPGYSLPTSSLRDDEHGSRTTVRVVPTSRFAKYVIFPSAHCKC